MRFSSFLDYGFNKTFMTSCSLTSQYPLSNSTIGKIWETYGLRSILPELMRLSILLQVIALRPIMLCRHISRRVIRKKGLYVIGSLKVPMKRSRCWSNYQKPRGAKSARRHSSWLDRRSYLWPAIPPAHLAVGIARHVQLSHQLHPIGELPDHAG